MNDRVRIEARQELIALISRILEENDATQWENNTAERFLEALAAWLNDAGGFYRNINEARDPNDASWQVFADALQAATIYE
jgi:hypothetical protein